MVDRKAQNAVGSCRSAMIFSHRFDAGEAALVNALLNRGSSRKRNPRTPVPPFLRIENG